MKRELKVFLDLFSKGLACDAYKFLGCHRETGAYVFRVWAPNAKSVSLVGRFNNWDKDAHIMRNIGYGVFEIFIKCAEIYDEYKYYICKRDGNFVYKSDPYAVHFSLNSEHNSKVYELPTYNWGDGEYLKAKRKKNFQREPINIYELHLGSFMKKADGSFLSYQELAKRLVKYLRKMNYTHVELLPVSEHPFYPSWGYQVMGYYAPSSRYGTPRDFMSFVDTLHKNGIAVIIDWVGAHFPKDECGLYQFDGTCLYEPADPLMREHPEWQTCVFDYSRYEVRSFLISNAVYWIDKYHIDGIRVDAVASMIYLDYGRKSNAFRPNKHGGNYNLDAIDFLKELNKAVFNFDKSVLMIAEESTAFPLVTKPGYDGGLGFNFKWNMGWMNDILDYFSTDPLFRKHKHNSLTFSMTYAFSENYVLPISHDEVVYGKRSLISKMPGSYEEKFANLRAFFGYMTAHPGKKLNFMGNELGQFKEWDYRSSVEWFLLAYPMHKKLLRYVKDLNRFYLQNRELWENDFDWHGFQWIAHDDTSQSVISFIRRDLSENEIIAVCNFCPVVRKKYRIGVSREGVYAPIMSSDSKIYGGFGTKLSKVKSQNIAMHGFKQSISITLPPLSTVFYKRIDTEKKEKTCVKP